MITRGNYSQLLSPIAYKAMMNEINRQKKRHKGGRKKGSIPWNKGLYGNKNKNSR